MRELGGLLRLTYVGFTVARKALPTDAVSFVLACDTRRGLTDGIWAVGTIQLRHVIIPGAVLSDITCITRERLRGQCGSITSFALAVVDVSRLWFRQ